ncbi:Alkaline phosphatase [Serinicoccus hydrothermalis]|uniref:Alkaline phosphatase n=1 Tax=Serinicoccus hydrothermalis TaxID=1758689 RepID=A0A1B1N9M9_9MICO|nr:hypothetical protein [Serinicoccus hydrothermalis]ANS78143.1 Alkaline phosphatase [Serinicoccus hydrothermalis]
MITLTRPDVWHLRAQTSCLQEAIDAWRGLRDAGGHAGADSADVTARLARAWEGNRADSYLDYAPRLTQGLELVHGMAQAVLTQLHALHDLTASTQRDLDASFSRASAVAASVRRLEDVEQVRFELDDEDDVEEVEREHDRARDLLEAARLEIAERSRALEATAADADTLAAAWAGPADGIPLWDTPLRGALGPGVRPLPERPGPRGVEHPPVEGADGGPTYDPQAR